MSKIRPSGRNCSDEFLEGLRKQQSTFAQIREVSEASAKASYLISNEIVLTSNPYSVAERISELSKDLTSQLKQRVGCFIAFSVAIAESTDIKDVAQLAIFIRSVDNTLTVTEEFVELVPIMDTKTAGFVGHPNGKWRPNTDLKRYRDKIVGLLAYFNKRFQLKPLIFRSTSN
ncbi:unnamed protein product [Lepeophtheirus salmonis]|uniref:(salmon louse) hypothetical protein n=1 Tax=Lepeophtheirus salmonis TaxID=72036 RepID=A0A7R8CZD5_LEPSM|nr:unnamed protein product [Lepeophtheirus salmonis]CAF2949420.1 unnamed protein product [Lepeophtheirus salmonis]